MTNPRPRRFSRMDGFIGVLAPRCPQGGRGKLGISVHFRDSFHIIFIALEFQYGPHASLDRIQVLRC